MLTGKEFLTLLIHTVVVIIIGTVLLLTTNKRTLLIMTFVIILTYIQTLVFDGCSLTKHEGPNINGSTIVKYSFGMGKSKIQLKDLEKTLVGLTLISYLGKLLLITFIEYKYKAPFTAALCSGKIGAPLKYLF
jgi:hypothetical protein